MHSIYTYSTTVDRKGLELGWNLVTIQEKAPWSISFAPLEVQVAVLEVQVAVLEVQVAVLVQVPLSSSPPPPYLYCYSDPPDH